MVVDVHTHAFPDSLAERAIPFLEEEGDIEACLDGKVSSLLTSMDEAGIDGSVVASIATKPEQFPSILKWSASIASRRIIPFPSVHPSDPDALARIGEVKNQGFRGIKLHPYYQDFFLDAPEVLPLYARIQREELVLLMHTGFDIAFERRRIADPERLETVVRRFPELKIIATHFGAWEDWDEVESRLIGKPVYIDTSHSIPFLTEGRARSFLLRHPMDRILFGSDSPWDDQAADIAALRGLALGVERTEAILGRNAERLLGID